MTNAVLSAARTTMPLIARDETPLPPFESPWLCRPALP